MLKQGLALLALAALISLPTAGEAAAKKKTVRAKPTPVAQHGRAQLKRAKLGYAYGGMYRRAHSPNPAWDVYWTNGKYAGSDPDPLVRDMLRRDNKVSSGDD